MPLRRLKRTARCAGDKPLDRNERSFRLAILIQQLSPLLILFLASRRFLLFAVRWVFVVRKRSFVPLLQGGMAAYLDKATRSDFSSWKDLPPYIFRIFLLSLSLFLSSSFFQSSDEQSQKQRQSPAQNISDSVPFRASLATVERCLDLYVFGIFVSCNFRKSL